MTHATVEEAGSWARSVRRWFDHEPALTGLCLVRAQHCEAGLAPRQPVFYRVEFDVESLLKVSRPLPGNDAKVRELLDQSLRGNHMGLNTRREPDGIYFSYNVAVVVAEPGSACAKLASSITSS